MCWPRRVRGCNRVPTPSRIRTSRCGPHSNRAAARIGDGFRQQPLVEASIRQTIGGAYQDLGLYPQAREQLQRASTCAGRPPARTTRPRRNCLGKLAELYVQEGKYPRGGIRLQHHAATPPRPAWRRACRRAGGDVRSRRALSIPRPLQAGRRTHRPGADDRPACAGPTASQHTDHDGQSGQHLTVSRETTARQAGALYGQVLDTQRRVLGTDHPDTLSTLSNLALSYSLQEQTSPPPSRSFSRRSRAEKRGVLGGEHPQTLITMNDLALMSKLTAELTKRNRCTTRSSKDGVTSSATNTPIRSAA